jgi:hypothetical protein
MELDFVPLVNATRELSNRAGGGHDDLLSRAGRGHGDLLNRMGWGHGGVLIC